MSKILIAIIIIASVSFPITAASEDLTDADVAHLIFMRSEEKLARDVYLKLAERYSNHPVFSRIATNAEQNHTDQILDKLKKFNIDDPEPSTLPDQLPPLAQIGVFENPHFKDYFEDKFEYLVGIGERNLLHALYVGAWIEELDMLDIRICNDAFYEYYTDPLPSDPKDCGGLSITKVRSLKNTLGNLLAGSENHLCAFISQLGPIMDDPPCYKARFLEQQEVRDIIEEQCSEFLDFICD